MRRGPVSEEEVLAVAARFAPGALRLQGRLGSGHIHETWAVERPSAAGRPDGLVLQHLNEEVFPDLAAVMDNLERLAAHPGVARWIAEPRRDREGGLLVRDARGGAWRAFTRIAPARSFDRVAGEPERAREAARAFAGFARGLGDLPPPPLREPLPGFHDTANRLEAFRAAAQRDACGRRAALRTEITEIERREPLAHALRDPSLPRRVVHGDTKINNLLFDADGLCARAVVDLDTVAPGLLAWDFGDLVRSAANTAPEDTPDLAAVGLDCPVFEALAGGWLEAGAGWMDETEVRSLATGALVMTYELALRFATDFLEGDRYFRIRDPAHNLRRVRVQLRLLRAMEASGPWMESVVAREAARYA